MGRTKLGRLLRSVALAAGVMTPGIWAGTAQADNLADAMVGAYNTSGLLEQNRALLRAADEDVAIAVSALRPIIDWSIQLQRAFQDRRSNGIPFDDQQSSLGGFIGFEQLLYDGGSAAFNKQAAQEQVLATRQTLINVEQTVLERAATAYLNVLFQEENVQLRINNVRVLGEELRASQDRFEVGEVTRTDVALSESRLAAARANLSDAEGQLLIAQAEYQNAVGKRITRTQGQPRIPRLPASVDEAIALANRNHPQILSAQHQVKAENLNVESVRATLGPSAFLLGNVGVVEDLDNTDFDNTGNISLELRQRLYNGGGRTAQVRRALAVRDSTRANLLNVQRNVRQGVQNAYSTFQTAGANLAASTERVRAAQIAFDGVREEATLGARTTLDVLTSEQDLLDAQTAEIFSRVERSLAAYQLLRAQGLLTAERLGLPVQIYDPTLYYNLVKDAPVQSSKRGKDLERVLEALGKK
ncbi:MAG: TolC family outer membrane protein [Pseudomonadota bacterium]